MATLSELLKLKGSTPGLYLLDQENYIRIGFRPSTGGVGGRTNILDSKSFPNTTEGRSEAIKYYNKLKNKYKAEIARYPTSQGFYMAQARAAYTDAKIGFADELVEEIDTLTKNPKYKTIKQVENQLFKKFNNPKYTVPGKGADPKNVFFDNKTKNFTIPREYKIYGGAYGKKKASENKTALKQLIGTKFFANNPNYAKTAGLLTAFYTNKDTDFTKKEIDTMRKFVKDFSITRSVKGDTIPARFFKELNFDFGKKLKDVGKIFNVTEYLQEQIKNPKISSADKNFYRQELNSFLDNRKGLLSKLGEKYPNLFKYKVSPGGNLQFEHRVARSLGETGDVKLPKDYIARGSYVPGRFNQAKYFNYDKPLMELVSEYNTASKTEKPNVRLKIENLTKDFNKRSGGFLESVGFDFKDKVKITDKSALVSKVKDADLLLDIDKSLQQSNKYFRSFGDETLKGMPKGSAASDFVLGGKEYGLFKKLVNTVKKSPQSCRAILDYQTGGISTTCAVALEKDPIGSAQKLAQLDDTGPLAKVKNAASSFLNFAKRGGKFGALAAAGAAGAGLVKTFMNDDPTTYLSNEDQQKNMLIEMVTGPMVDEPDPTPEILDWQLPAIGATAAAGTAVTAPSTIEAARSARFGKKPSGYTKTALKTLGRGLAATGTPLGLAAFEPLHIAGQVQAGDSLGEIATNPWNYAGLAFADDLTKFTTKGLGPNIAKAMRLGISPAALKVGSRFLGLPGLALSLGISGYETYDDWKNKRGWFREE